MNLPYKVYPEAYNFFKHIKQAKDANMRDFGLYHLEDGEYKLESPLQGEFNKSITISNNSGHDILMVERSGLPVIISSTGFNGTGITIEVSYYIGHNSMCDPYNTFMNSATDDPESELILKMLARRNSSDMNDRRSANQFRMRYNINNDSFKRLGKSIYIVELDILLTRETSTKHPRHPYSATHTRADRIDEEVNGDIPNFSSRMFIIDNNGEVGNRFINIHGDVFKIPASVNTSLQSGFYICGSSPVVSEVTVESDQEVISIEEAHKRYRLYATYIDAKREGDVVAKYELELANTTERIENMKREAREAEVAYKLLQAELQKEMDEKSHSHKIAELDRKQLEEERKDWFDARSVHRKDTYEGRSLQRKDVYEGASLDRKSQYESTSVGLKTGASVGAALPAIAGGVLAVVALLIKFFK